MDRQTLSIMKACEAVGVSRRTIYNWISAGKVEDVRTAGGSIRIFADTLWRDAAAARAEESNSRARVRIARVTGLQTTSADADSQSGLDLQALFHRLNNQLGVLLAQAELLEAKAADDASVCAPPKSSQHARRALTTVREIRQRTELTALTLSHNQFFLGSDNPATLLNVPRTHPES